MSNSWSGFSEEDIKKFKTGQVKTEDKPNKRVIKAKRKLPQKTVVNKPTEVLLNDLSQDAKLSDTPNDLQPVDESPKILNQSDEDNLKINGGIKEDKNTVIKCNAITLNIPGAEKKVIDLDEFLARQQRIEEQNRRRKELLAKALADRTKQTEEESKRLKEIQGEFKKLDAILSNDVAILRHQIELASLDFMEAQKRYHKVEKEFLDAKMVLHQKLEKKDMLTEHLCAIIEKNEERKAEKLNELMDRLTTGSATEKNHINTENAAVENGNKIENIQNNESIEQ